MAFTSWRQSTPSRYSAASAATPLKQEIFSVKSCHAASARGGYRLTIDLVAHVTAGEHSGHAVTGRSSLDDDVAIIIKVELVLEQLGRGLVADRDEHAFDVRCGSSRPCACCGCRGRSTLRGRRLRQTRPSIAVPDHVDFLVREKAVLKNFLCPQAVAAVNQSDVVADGWSCTELLRQRCCRRRSQRPSCPDRRTRRKSRKRNARLPFIRSSDGSPAISLERGGDHQRIGEIMGAAVAR